MRRFRLWWFGMLVVCFVSACGGGDTPSSVDDPDDTPNQPTDPDDPDEPDPPQGDPDSPFECERQAYPCTWQDAGEAVLDASSATGRQAFAMLDAGQTIAQTVTWLESQDDVAEVIGGDTAIRFRLEGGRPTWVFGPGAINIPDGGPPPGPALTPEPAQTVVGDQPKTKTALILSPYQWDFGVWDEGAELAAYMNGVRGYDGNVVYLANTEQQAGNVTWQQFVGWDEYDAVHVSTHGVQICPEDDECFTVVTAGDVATEVVLTAPEQGVDLVIAGTDAQATETVYESVGLSTDFFTEQYPGGLSDTIVYFSACQTTLGNDLESALAGDEAAVLGWTESVWSDTGRAAALAFWQGLGEKGIPATAAYEALGGLTVDRPNSDGAIAVLSIYPGTEESPRVREIPYPRNPLNSKDLPNDTPYPIIGVFEDGQPDRIPFMIKVDGVEGDPSDFVVHVDINGFSADPKPLSEGMMIDGEGNVWQVEGDIPVTFDAQYGQEITVKARVELPEGGESEWEEDAILGEFSLRFRSTIVVEADESFLVRTESKTRANVYFAPDEGGVSFPVSGILTYEEFNIELSGNCTGNAITYPGTLRVLDADLRVENGRLAVPDFVSLYIPPSGTRETAFLTCNGITFSIPLIQFFAGFYAFHGGGLCGAEAEYSEANPEAGIVITGWSAGNDEVAARKTYDRSCTDEEGVTTSENTTIEIIYPPMDEQM